MPPKTAKKDKVACTDHVFSFRPKTSFCYYHQTLNIDICKRAMCGRGKKPEIDCYEGPVFNKDKNSQTPTFILASEKKKFESLEFRANIENDSRYNAIKYEKSLLLVPKPNSKSMYCSVCKERYEDYLDHINSTKHRYNIRNNTFTQYVLEQADNFKEKDPTHFAVPTAETSNVIVISSDEEQEERIKQMGKPKKKVKRCAQFYENKMGNLEEGERAKPEEKMKLPILIEEPQKQPLIYHPQPIIAQNYPFNFNFNYNLNLFGMGPFQGMPQPMTVFPQFSLGCMPGLPAANQMGFNFVNSDKNLRMIERK